MATTPPSTRKRASKPATDVFTCPECGKTFTRAAALGAHRKMTHGISGTSKNATSSRTNAATSRKRSTATSSRGRSTTAAANGGAQPVDRDALLRTLFPAGIPPRQDVITLVNAWLDEAERLARSR
jgi:hypothetical protein